MEYFMFQVKIKCKVEIKLVCYFQRLAHAVLAGDADLASEILKKDSKVNLNLRNMVCTCLYIDQLKIKRL